MHARKRKVWGSVQEVETSTAQWVHWFNTMRVHSSIGYQTPTEFENNYNQQTTPETLSA
ncbi:integrase core domain-containing protein [Neomicrococcus lactis]|uniref:integrase core domain-containing protein n=1 Tax=Neomicrococcus lactis TaxID=732241 RepID=UPI003A5C8735